MIITTWNINSVRLRIAMLSKIIEQISPDILCLQETKVPDNLFPCSEISALGYPHQAYAGMKSYNGVAILSRWPLFDVNIFEWCKKKDCRHISAKIKKDFSNPIQIHNIYVPAGGDIPDPKKNEKFAHKLGFLKELTSWQKKELKKQQHQVLLGDFNIAPLETDVWSHKQLLKVVSHTPVEVNALEKLRKAGNLTDAVREVIFPEEPLFSWWSYRSKDWTINNRGRRLDHIWVTNSLKNKILSAHVLKDARGWKRPSDHVPVTIKLSP